MRHPLLKPVLAFALLGLPLVACQTNSGTGAATGAAGEAIVGAMVGGPVGAAVGGVAGAVTGGVLTADETTRVRTYVVNQRRPSIRVAEPILVGQPLPS